MYLPIKAIVTAFLMAHGGVESPHMFHNATQVVCSSNQAPVFLVADAPPYPLLQVFQRSTYSCFDRPPLNVLHNSLEYHGRQARYLESARREWARFGNDVTAQEQIKKIKTQHAFHQREFKNSAMKFLIAQAQAKKKKARKNRA